MRTRTRWILGLVALAAAGLVTGCYSSADDDKAPPVIVLDDTGGGSGGGGTGGSDTGMPTDTGGGQSCNAGLEKCGGSCVNVSNNASHCGQCGNSCGGQPCDNGQCVTQPDDCTQPGSSCQGFTYCDLGSGECKPGCGSDDQCGPNSSCDIGSRECSCDSGFHACNGQCVSDSSPNSCGSRCTPCPSDPNGSATCSAGSCGLSCQSGYRNCGGQCVSCPSGGPGSKTTCNGSRCELTCKSGYITCSTGCCPGKIETIDDTGTAAKELGGVVVDSQGTPHAIYTFESSNTNGRRVLKHATRQSGSWTSRTIQVGGQDVDVGSSSGRLAIDSRDNLYTYYDDSGPHLLYQESGSWKSREVTGSGRDVVTIEIDSSDKPHLLAEGKQHNKYRYHYWDGSAWTDEVVNPTYSFNKAELAVDSTGTPHVTGWDQAHGYLYYGTKKQGSWSVEKIAQAAFQSPHHVRIVVDQSDVPHLFLADGQSEKFYEAVPGSNQWQTKVIHQASGSRFATLYTLDGGYSGRPMGIAYAYDGGVYYGRERGGSWTFESASALGSIIARQSTYVVDSNGDPHFLWEDRNNGDIRYAH